MNNLIDLHSNLPRSTQSLLAKIREWGRSELEPVVGEYWEKGEFPTHALQSFRDRLPSLLGYTVPSRYRSNPEEYDLLTACLVSMTIASLDASFVTALLVQYGLCCESIVLCGTEEQKRRLLPSLSSLGRTGCFCLTEPQSGSNASDLQTVATQLPSGGYHVTGPKRWIGNGVEADVHVVWAKNLSMPGQPVMGFIVEREHQTSDGQRQIQTSKIGGKVSLRMVQNADIYFQDALVPPQNVMAGHGT
jgi:glutaryl-CoA dehydrogenase